MRRMYDPGLYEQRQAEMADGIVLAIHTASQKDVHATDC